MKKMKCVNNYKVNRIMKNFLNIASDLMYDKGQVPLEKAWQTPDGEWHWNNEDIVWTKAKKKICLNKGKKCCAFVSDDIKQEETDFSMIHYNFDELWNDNGAFRKFWQNEYPMLRGFADITLILLHELGHHETNDQIVEDGFTKAEREELMEEIQDYYTYIDEEAKIMYVDKESIENEYFQMPDETAATEWAINWLSNPENRKKAKAFEKKFFACFE